MGQRCEFKDLDGTYVCEYLGGVGTFLILVIFSIQREVTSGGRLRPQLRLQRRHQRVRRGHHHRPRDRHRGSSVHQAETESQDEEDRGDEVREREELLVVLTRDISQG